MTEKYKMMQVIKFSVGGWNGEESLVFYEILMYLSSRRENLWDIG